MRDLDPDDPSSVDETDPLLAVEDLRTTFPTEDGRIRAVDGVSLTVHRGETVCIVGESGSGKTVTARSITGLVGAAGTVHESSSVRLDGRELTAMSDDAWESVRGSDVAMVFQDPSEALNPVYTVGNQLREALRYGQGITGTAAHERAVDLLTDVGIPDAERRLDEYPHQFSGGMRQRVVVATAIACDPDLLIADEPTTGLDVTIQAQLLDLLEDLQADRGFGLLFITHNMGVVAQIADRVNVMYAGEIVERAPVVELFENPGHPYTEGLLGSLPWNQVGVDRLQTIEGTVPTPTSPATSCRFAPRCPHAWDDCRQVNPSLVPVADDESSPGGPGDVDDGAHRAACLLRPDGLSEAERVHRHRIDSRSPDGREATDE